MIQITKSEAKYLRQYDPSIFIAITGRHKKSKNKKYYVSEQPDVLRLLPDNAEAKRILSRMKRWRRGRR